MHAEARRRRAGRAEEQSIGSPLPTLQRGAVYAASTPSGVPLHFPQKHVPSIISAGLKLVPIKHQPSARSRWAKDERDGFFDVTKEA